MQRARNRIVNGPSQNVRITGARQYSWEDLQLSALIFVLRSQTIRLSFKSLKQRICQWVWSLEKHIWVRGWEWYCLKIRLGCMINLSASIWLGGGRRELQNLRNIRRAHLDNSDLIGNKGAYALGTLFLISSWSSGRRAWKAMTVPCYAIWSCTRDQMLKSDFSYELS